MRAGYHSKGKTTQYPPTSRRISNKILYPLRAGDARIKIKVNEISSAKGQIGEPTFVAYYQFSNWKKANKFEHSDSTR